MTDVVSPAEEVTGRSVERSLRLSRLSDELLAHQAARGSERAFAVLYGRYHEPLYGYCLSIVRHEADAQDALQSTFAAALAGLKRRKRNAPLRPWLFRIAHNQAVSIIRRRNSEADKQHVHNDALVAASAEDQAAERARWALLTADLAELPERLKGALLLRELSGLSHDEIATVLGTTIGGAKQAIFEARQELAVFAEGRAMDCEQVRRRLSDGDGRVLRGRLMRAHLRDCASCEAFATAIPSRRAELRALTPALPSAAAAGVLSHVIRSASGHGTSASSAASAAATAGAVGKSAGALVTLKTVTTAAAVLVTAAGVIGVKHALRPSASVRPPASHRPMTRAPAAREAHRSGETPQTTYRGVTRGTVATERPSRGAHVRRQTEVRTPSRASKQRHGSPHASARGHSGAGTAGTKSHGTPVTPVMGHHGHAASHGPPAGHGSSSRSPSPAHGPKSTKRATSPSRGKAGQVHTPSHVHKVAVGHRSTPKVKSTSHGHSHTAHPAPGTSTTGVHPGADKHQVKTNS